MMLRSVADLELMMAPTKTRLGSRCGAGMAGRKFSEADVGYPLPPNGGRRLGRAMVMMAARRGYESVARFSCDDGLDGCAARAGPKELLAV